MDIYLCPICGDVFDSAEEHPADECRQDATHKLEEQLLLLQFVNCPKEVETDD